MTVTTCSCICDNFTFTFPRNCFLMHPFWIPFPFCPYLPLCTHPQEVIMQVALPCVESAISSSFPSSHENWIFLGPVTDFPKIPFSCCMQNAAAERLLIVWVNLTIKRDATFISFFIFFSCFAWLYLVDTAHLNFASQVFSVYISYRVPSASVFPAECGLILAIPDILLVTSEGKDQHNVSTCEFISA